MWRPLHLLKIEALFLIVQYDADVNAKSKSGLTALHLGTQRGNIKAIEYLLPKDGNVNDRKKRENGFALGRTLRTLMVTCSMVLSCTHHLDCYAAIHRPFPE